jgi:hypothetical protein
MEVELTSSKQIGSSRVFTEGHNNYETSGPDLHSIAIHAIPVREQVFILSVLKLS